MKWALNMPKSLSNKGGSKEPLLSSPQVEKEDAANVSAQYPKLERACATEYRALAARANHLSMDRPDIQIVPK